MLNRTLRESRPRQFDFSFFKNPSSSIALTMLGSIIVVASNFDTSGLVRAIVLLLGDEAIR